MYSARSDPCLIDSPSSKHFACYQAGLLKGLLCSLRSHESLSPYTFAQEGFCAHFVRTKALHRTLLHRKAFVLTSFARKPFTVHFCTGRLLCSLRSHESRSSKGRVSPFRHLRIKACLPAPRSFSQATTSFVACNRQGIHHMHLFA